MNAHAHNRLTTEPIMPDDTSQTIARISDSVAKILEAVPPSHLPAVLKAIEEGPMKSAKDRIQTNGGDAVVEGLMKRVKANWIGNDNVDEAILRRLVGSIKLTKGLTRFDGEGSSWGNNSQAAEFDVEFKVGGKAEGYFNGEVVSSEGEHSGRIESNFFMIEDDLDNTKANWSDEMINLLRDDAKKWRSAAGLSEKDISWQAVSKVVAGAICALVDKCEYNQDDWVWEYVTERTKTEMARLPDASVADGSNSKKRKTDKE